jgi:hypothetical protein
MKKACTNSHAPISGMVTMHFKKLSLIPARGSAQTGTGIKVRMHICMHIQASSSSLIISGAAAALSAPGHLHKFLISRRNITKRTIN